MFSLTATERLYLPLSIPLRFELDGEWGLEVTNPEDAKSPGLVDSATLPQSPPGLVLQVEVRVGVHPNVGYVSHAILVYMTPEC